MKKTALKITKCLFFIIIFFYLILPVISLAADNPLQQEDNKIYLEVPLPGLPTVNNLGEYIAAIYKLGILFLAVTCVIALLIGGIKYILSAGNPAKAKEGVTFIKSSIIGLVLGLSSYLILYTINPNLTRLTVSTVENIPNIKFVETAVDANSITTGAPITSGETTAISGDNITVQTSANQIFTYLLPKLQAAALTLKAQGINVVVTSGMRSREQQIGLVKQNCTLNGGVTCDTSLNCTPYTPQSRYCSPITCIPTVNINCTHILDVWGVKNGQQCGISQDACLQNLNNCETNTCQKDVIAAMRANGFCKYGPEAWHFEDAAHPISSPCN